MKEEDVTVSVVKIDLTRGSSNPLERYLRKNIMYLMKALMKALFLLLSSLTDLLLII